MAILFLLSPVTFHLSPVFSAEVELIKKLHEEPEEEIIWGGPKVGEEAPLFTLKNLLGQEIKLEDFYRKKPVVLITGSYSCPIYRQNHTGLQQLYNRYGSRAAFYVLYTVEAHPRGENSPYADREWLTQENREEKIFVKQPVTYKERIRVASQCQSALTSDIPVLVDGIDNAVWKQYGSAPNAAYLIDSKGMVQVRQDWFDPLKFEKAFLKAMQDEPAKW